MKDDDDDPRLRGWVQAGLAALGELPLGAEALTAHLRRVLPAEETQEPGGAATLHLGDLALACAVLERVPGAAERLREQLHGVVRAQLSGMRLDADAIEDLEQRLFVRLVVGHEAPPALASYSGRASLQTFARLAATRLAYNRHRDRQVEDARAIELARTASWLEMEGAESQLIKDELKARFKTALGQALGDLGERERLLLRLHLLDGLSIDDIGRVLLVHRSTAARQLVRLKADLVERVSSAIAQDGMDAQEIGEVIAALRSRIDLSLSRLLGDS